jgi:hypothetical protein
MEESWQVVEEVAGSGLAEMLRGLLEAQEIPVLLSQEGAGHFAFATTVGRLGWVQILVPDSHLAQAHEILAAYHAGELIAPDIELDTNEVADGEEDFIEDD